MNTTRNLSIIWLATILFGLISLLIGGTPMDSYLASGMVIAAIIETQKDKI